MRSFSEFGYCCGLVVDADPPASQRDPPRKQSTATIQRNSRAIDPLQRKSRSSGHWRPSLSVISEDGAIVSHDSNRRGQETRREKISLSDASKSVDQMDEVSYSVDGGSKRQNNSALSMAMPAFSPTPFMF